MNRIRKFLALVANILLFLVVIGLWGLLPWPVLLGLLALFAVWLATTRTGRVASTTIGIALSTLPQRWGGASVIVVGIAGVVGVLVAMLAMAAGFQSTIDGTGRDDTAIVLRSGALSESNSVIARGQVPLIGQLPGIARDADGAPLMSAELGQVATLPSRADGEDANVLLRGIGPAGWGLRPQVRLIEGRKFREGTRELVVGAGARGRFDGLEPGRTLVLANQTWTVVGVFRSGDGHDSELWTDAETLVSAYRRPALQSVTVKLEGGDALERLQAGLAADPRLKLEASTTRAYYGKQSAALSGLIQVLGTVVGLIMAIGALFGALNTMYAAVAERAREIATLRAIGFHGFPVVAGVIVEVMLLAAAGGIIGALLAWLAFNGYTASTLSGDFSQIVFRFDVSADILLTGLKWALGIGLVGGLMPALRAARMQVTDALRTSH